MQLFLSPDAFTALEEIATYTVERFGNHQALRYKSGLQKAFAAIRDNPELIGSKPVDHLRKGCRRYAVGKHVIFYETHNDHIIVLHILHQSMLPETI